MPNSINFLVSLHLALLLGAPSTTEIYTRPFLLNAPTKQCPALLVYPVLIPAAPAMESRNWSVVDTLNTRPEETLANR